MDLIFTLAEIEFAAQQFISAIGTNTVFAFEGEMGAGKTTFIQAVCTVLKVNDLVTSPSFSIINEYTTTNKKIIFHLDLYRLKDDEEAINAGVEDCFLSKNFCFVEWPQRAKNILPPETVFVQIVVLDINKRKLTM